MENLEQARKELLKKAKQRTKSLEDMSSKTPLAVYIGDKVKAYRTEQNISQRDLASFVPMTRSNLSLLENGFHLTVLDRLYRIAALLGCNIIDLIPSSMNELEQEEG